MGVQFLDFVGGGEHNCYERRHVPHGEVLPSPTPTRKNPGERFMKQCIQLFLVIYLMLCCCKGLSILQIYCFNYKKFIDFVKEIYPFELKVEKANRLDDHANYDIHHK